MDAFRTSLEQFNAKRTNIERLYDKYKDAPATLFKDCFAREPQGEVDLIKTPFMLLIRCHDPKDFEVAMTYRGVDETDSDIYHYTPEDAENAAGFAYTELLEPILNEAYKGVAVEKVPKEDQERCEYDDHEIRNRDDYDNYGNARYADQGPRRAT